MNKRHAASAIILFAVIFLPYWLYLPLLLAALIIFPLYWEGIFFGFLIDVLHGRGISAFPSLLSPIAFISALILVVLLPLRERLRFHV